MAHGVNQVMIEDAADFQNFLSDTTVYWDYVDEGLMEKMEHCDTKVKFYLTDTPDGYETLSQIKSDLTRLPAAEEGIDLGPLTVEVVYKEQEEWETAWQKYYHPIEISGNLIIVPEWEKVDLKPGQKQLLLNPGMAFGTGGHNTTRPGPLDAGQAAGGGGEGAGHGLRQRDSVDCGAASGGRRGDGGRHRPAGGQDRRGKTPSRNGRPG